MAIKILDVGPRDGLQNESAILTPALRIDLIQRLLNSGLNNIETGAFVSPKAIPQMIGSDLVAQHFSSTHGQFPALVPNLKGLESAIASGVKEIAIFTAASNSFTQKNINASITESLERFKQVCEIAKQNQIKIRGYVSCVVHCPYEGYILPSQVIPVCEALADIGCYEISLGDTTGRGTSKQMKSLLSTLFKSFSPVQLAGHFHDTYGQGIANIATCLDAGLESFDASIAGLGGCPYAPGASGNVATEDLVYLLQGWGIATNIDLQRLAETGSWISQQLGKAYLSKAGQGILAQACN